MKKKRIQPTALILISTGFDEELTIACLKHLRSSGVGVKLVGLTVGLLVGTGGLAVRPDITMANLETHRGYRLIVIPGHTESTQSLLVDPRVHQLLTVTIKEGGRVAVMGTAEKAFVQADQLELLAHPRVMVQGGQDTADLINLLIYQTAT